MMERKMAKENVTNLAAMIDRSEFVEIESNKFYKVAALQGTGEDTNSLYKREDGEWVLVDFEEDPHAFDYLKNDVWESAEGELVPDEFVEAWDVSQELEKPLYETTVYAYQQDDTEGIIKEIEGS
jgi:hypothetical protein